MYDLIIFPNCKQKKRAHPDNQTEDMEFLFCFFSLSLPQGTDSLFNHQDIYCFSGWQKKKEILIKDYHHLLFTDSDRCLPKQK